VAVPDMMKATAMLLPVKAKDVIAMIVIANMRG
jgi:hypothetical protein